MVVYVFHTRVRLCKKRDEATILSLCLEYSCSIICGGRVSGLFWEFYSLGLPPLLSFTLNDKEGGIDCDPLT